MCYHAKFRQHKQIGTQKLGGDGASFLNWYVGVADLLKTCPLHVCVTLPYLVVLRQRVYA